MGHFRPVHLREVLMDGSKGSTMYQAGCNDVIERFGANWRFAQDGCIDYGHGIYQCSD